jgi:hypothetical protein
MVVQYIHSTWLVHKELFVKCWTDQHFHLGTRTTSRVEGAHSTLKKYLVSSTGNFAIFIEKVDKYLKTQQNDIQVRLARDSARIP